MIAAIVGAVASTVVFFGIDKILEENNIPRTGMCDMFYYPVDCEPQEESMVDIGLSAIVGVYNNFFGD